ncbi:hypothetical protein RVV18_000026 [Burkholderia ambifaria]|nr:hypothetical protein [Burkholderia ambifaria]
MATLYDKVIASYDDSFGVENLDNPLHPKMHKLHHDLRMVIDGPDGKDVSNCLGQAAIVGAIAAVIAAYTGGAAAALAEQAATETLIGCLGADCSIGFPSTTNWIYWNV